MKKLIGFLKMLVLASCIAASYYAKSLAPLPEQKIVLLKKSTDDRGYISIQYKVDRDTFAYDYLRREDFETFLRTGDPYSNN